MDITPQSHQPAPDDDLREAARAFFPDATSIEPAALGNHLVRVAAPSGDWCVRRWPSDAPQERLRFVHALLDQLREAGIEVVPNVAGLASEPGERILTLRGNLYDAQTRLPGRPLGRHTQGLSPSGEHVNLPVALPEPAMTELVEMVARLHEATRSLARSREAPTAPLASVAAAVRQSWAAHRAQLRPLAARTPAIQRWIRLGEQALPAAVSTLEAAPDHFRETRVVGHHDLWPAHALFRRQDGAERLTGILDFADAAAGSPLLDLAQLATHFGGWRIETAEMVLGTYGAVARLLPEERRLLPAVAALDLIAEAGWLLVVAFAAAHPDAPPASSAVRKGAVTMVDSLEAITPLVVRGDAPARPKTRRWVPGPKRTGRAKGKPVAKRTRPGRDS